MLRDRSREKSDREALATLGASAQTAIFALELPNAAHAQLSPKTNSTETVALSTKDIFRACV